MRLRSSAKRPGSDDIDRIVSTLAPDAELLSPLSGRMVFRGRDDLRVLLGAVYGGLSNLVWREVIGERATRVAVSDARIAGVTITGAMVLQFDESAGLIVRIRPHLRPWLAITLFALFAGAEDSPPSRRAAPRSATLTPNHLCSAACNRSSSPGLESVCRPGDVTVGPDQQRAGLNIGGRYRPRHRRGRPIRVSRPQPVCRTGRAQPGGRGGAGR